MWSSLLHLHLYYIFLLFIHMSMLKNAHDWWSVVGDGVHASISRPLAHNLGFGKRLYLIIKGNFDSIFSNLSPGGSHKSHSNPSAGNVQSWLKKMLSIMAMCRHTWRGSPSTTRAMRVLGMTIIREEIMTFPTLSVPGR